MDSLIKDIRYGVRSLLRRPAFTAIALLTIALGIGVNSTIFSLVNATLMQRLPVTDPDHLVYVFSGNPGSVFSYPDYAELRDQNQIFDGMIAWGGINVSLNSNDQTDLEGGAIVTGNFFQVLGVQAQLGRVITPDDDRIPDAHPVTVISHNLWQRRFAADPNVVGRQLLLNGQTFTIIGVTPPGFNGAQLGTLRNIYVPMMMQAVMRPPRAGYSGEMNSDLLQKRSSRWLSSIGRLKPGVSVQQAQAALAVIVKQQEQAYAEDRGRTVTVHTVNGGEDPDTRRQMGSVAMLLMSVVGIVLLIACANVANLLLARGAARTKEIAVRLAIGANRWHVVRQLLTESVLLALAGGCVGLLLAWWSTSLLKAAPPPPGALPIAPALAMDRRVLLFTFGLSFLSAIVFGLAPALRSSRPELTPALKEEVVSGDERTRFFNLRNLLVVLQVALSLVLLITAGLFLRSLRRAQSINPGFDAERVLTVPLNINLLRYKSTQGAQFYRQAVERVEAIPGVESASLARIIALSGGSSVRSLLIEGTAGSNNDFRSEGAGAARDLNSISTNVVSAKYFQTVGIGFTRGRDFNTQDTPERPRVIVVNEAFARLHFPGEEPLGHRVSFNGSPGPWHEIVGVVRDSKYLTINEPPTPVAYLPLQQNHETGMTLHIRTRNQNIGAAIRNEIQALDRNIPVSMPVLMSEAIGTSLYAARMGAVLLVVFGGLALSLAAVGLYGVMSFSVSRRTRELGIRMALGAQTKDVFKLVMRQGMVLVLSGTALGLGASFMITRLLASFLYGISATDAITFTSIPVILGAVALLACFLPARRATKLDPLVALRYE